MPDEAWKNSKGAKEYEEWLANARRDLQPRTADDYARTVRDLLVAHPEKEMKDFTTADCQRLLDQYPAGSREARRFALRSFFQQPYLDERILANPVDRVRVPKTRRRRPTQDVFNDIEVQKLYGLDSPDGALFVLMIECGLRKRECRALRLRDVDLERRYITVRTRGEPHVPLTARALRAVRELEAEEGLATGDHLWGTRPGGGSVVHREKPISQTAFQGWYRESLRKAGVRHREARTTHRTFEHRSKLGAASGTPPSVDSDLLRRLDALDPNLAASYTQVHRDFVDDTRLSFLGPAGEIREVMRAVIHRLAPTDDVQEQTWYVGRDDKPTQAERIRFILESRSRAEKSATDAAGMVDDRVGKLGRTLYTRASRAFHAGTQREEVSKIVGYVEAVLNEVLPP